MIRKFSKFAKFKTIPSAKFKKTGIQKIPAQKSELPIAFQKRNEEIALQKSRSVLGEAPEYLGFSDKSIRDMAAESLALKTESRSYFSNLKKALKRERQYQANQIKFIRQRGKGKFLRKTKSTFVIPKEKLREKESFSYTYKAKSVIPKGPRGTDKFNKRIRKGETISVTGFPVGINPGAGTIFKGSQKIKKIPKYTLRQNERFSKLGKTIQKKSSDIYSKTLETFTGKRKSSSFTKRNESIIKKPETSRSQKLDWGFDESNSNPFNNWKFR